MPFAPWTFRSLGGPFLVLLGAALLLPRCIPRSDDDDDCLDRPLAPSVGLSGYDLFEPMPDILLLSISGHAPSLTAITCEDDENTNYLRDSAAPVLETFFEALGLSVVRRDFADRLQADDSDGDGRADDLAQLGFLDLLAILDRAEELWFENGSSSTRIVLVCHSHGSNWAHLATAVRPDLPFHYLITLDGVVTAWECEHQCNVSRWLVRDGLSFDFDVSRPEERIDVPGLDDRQHVKDVVFPNVLVNLEVQSFGPPPLDDCCDNHRTDGSTTGIFTEVPGEDHSTVHLPGSDSMTWVLEQLMNLEGV